jgi:hypothetical protein
MFYSIIARYDYYSANFAINKREIRCVFYSQKKIKNCAKTISQNCFNQEKKRSKNINRTKKNVQKIQDQTKK